ncbi:MAG: ribonuclease VapC [Thermoplasmataceae archaeon]
MSETKPTGVYEETRFVVDTSGILSRRLNLLDRRLVFPSQVLTEIRRGKLGSHIDTISTEIMVYDASESSRKYVTEEAATTGDIAVLSETDIAVLAAAYELKCGIITDDYAIQNVAGSLNIPYQGSDLKPISRRVRWIFKCTGCGKTYKSHRENCEVCGHSVGRISIRKAGKK